MQKLVVKKYRNEEIEGCCLPAADLDFLCRRLQSYNLHHVTVGFMRSKISMITGEVREDTDLDGLYAEIHNCCSMEVALIDCDNNEVTHI